MHRSSYSISSYYVGGAPVGTTLSWSKSFWIPGCSTFVWFKVLQFVSRQHQRMPALRDTMGLFTIQVKKVKERELKWGSCRLFFKGQLFASVAGRTDIVPIYVGVNNYSSIIHFSWKMTGVEELICRNPFQIELFHFFHLARRCPTGMKCKAVMSNEVVLALPGVPSTPCSLVKSHS